MEQRTVALRGGMFETSLLEGGQGRPLLYLHGTWGAVWGSFLETLAADWRVIAPRHPGFGESTGNERLLDLQALIYYELDLLDALDLHGLPLIGHSFGGMLAAELAAVQPQRFSHLVLLAPLGLWNDAHPVPDFFTFGPEQLAAAFFHDTSSLPAVAAAEIPTDQEAMITYQLERARALATTAKYLWPIPNRGLSKRIHRITMPTLLVWGQRDGICPPEYAANFQALIPQARTEIIPEAAHLVQIEQPERLAELVGEFLAECERDSAGPRTPSPRGRGSG